MRPLVVLSLCLLALVGFSRADDDDVQQVATGHRPTGLQDGANCQNNDQCLSRCCLKVFHGDGAGSPGECRPAAGPGERCSYEQVKGGANVNYCPCRVGICGDDDICPSEDTSAEGDHD
ncbi:hypothetical protein HPB49_016232 [Dermacentor silvarum]|uniref:Uncharacterized protein n=1 Tax=Dermacentor silvarum TaxID=543639 RepID=A0ACB8E123_DERSI|nr:U-scoloptoxin(18)-Er1a [Dermacentor silvarum]KAH7980445.1 hypothetical protein HPB49_016232 [Dermacentor silvarum]